MNFSNQTTDVDLELTLSTVSKLCSDVIHQDKINIKQRPIPVIDDVYNKIHEIFPTFYDTDYKLYWRYSQKKFLRIFDYVTYFTALTLATDRCIYLLLSDCDDNWEDNESYLKELDLRELEEEKERKRDKYDVVIKRKGEEDQEEAKPRLEPPGKERTDGEILSYALRKLPEVEPFTADLLQKANLIRDVKKGIYHSLSLLLASGISRPLTFA